MGGHYMKQPTVVQANEADKPVDRFVFVSHYLFTVVEFAPQRSS